MEKVKYYSDSMTIRGTRAELMADFAELLRSHGHAVRSHLHDALAERGLTPPQLWALHGVAEARSMGDLAGFLGVDASYVTGLADALEAKGLVERRPSETDRRVRLLAATAAGRRLLDEVHATVLTEVPLGESLTDDELETLVGLLRRSLPERSQGC